MRHIIDFGRRNRYHHHIWLDEKEPNLFKLCAEQDYIINYASISYNNLPEDADDYDFYDEDKHIKGIIMSIDPDGGPYLSVGSYFFGYKITRIFYIDSDIYIMMCEEK